MASLEYHMGTVVLNYAESNKKCIEAAKNGILLCGVLPEFVTVLPGDPVPEITHEVSDAVLKRHLDRFLR